MPFSPIYSYFENMRKIGILAILHLAIYASNSPATTLEFSVSLAFDRPLYKTLPGLTTGIGWGFSIGILPVERAGFAIGINSTQHKLNADTASDRLVKGDSRRMSLYFQGHYCFIQIKNVDFEVYLAATYNSINGGDNSGSYLDLNVDPEEIGYTGWGTQFGVGVVSSFAEYYSLEFTVKYNLLNYSKHQMPSFLRDGPEPFRHGSSLVFNLGIIYRIDFDKF